MADIIQLRRDTAANWASANPILAQGEPGIELDTDYLKWGDGSTAWNSLNYAISSPTIAVPVRNTVMSGPTSWLAAGTGLQVVSQNGAAIATIADGFNIANGEDNRIFEIPNATAWNSLASSSTVYLWVEHDGSTLTTGSGTLAPAYGPTAPSSPATGQWWFDTVNYKGFSWDGSAWVADPRLYVGQATTDGSGVTAVVQYAYLGRHVAEIDPANSTTISVAHRLGTVRYGLRMRGVFTSATNGYSIGDPIDLSSAFASTSTSSQGVTPEPLVNAVDLHFGSGGWQAIRPDTYATASATNWNQLDATVFIERDF